MEPIDQRELRDDQLLMGSARSGAVMAGMTTAGDASLQNRGAA
jgi:hypothetical protein